MPYGGFEPQTAVCIAPVHLDNPIVANSVRDRVIFSVPDGVNFRVEVLSVGFSVVTVPVDADGTILCDIEWVDDSAGDAKANLKAGVDLEALTVDVYNAGWLGSQILDPGDSINLEFTNNSAAIDTAALGLIAFVEYRVLQRS